MPKSKFSVIIERMSVCAGDDVDAPHQKLLYFNPSVSVSDCLKTISELSYLPQISGGKATWVASANIPLAVIAQEWLEPRYLVDPLSPLEGLLGKIQKKIRFFYLAQESPDVVFDRELKKPI